MWTLRLVATRDCTVTSRSLFGNSVARFSSSSLDSSTHSKRNKKTKQKGNYGRQVHLFVDRTNVRVSGGSGGRGSTSIHKLGKVKRRPDGGNGGHGGSVILLADSKTTNLRWTHPHVRAEEGQRGMSKGMTGRNGENLIVKVPCGVVVRRVIQPDEEWDEKNKTATKIEVEDDDQESSEYGMNDGSDDAYGSEMFLDGNIPIYHPPSANDDSFLMEEEQYRDAEREMVVLADLDKDGAHVVVARGGRGGFGNIRFASRNGQPPPDHVLSQMAQPVEGESAALQLELKLIADVGLVGFPNAGKSSLLSAMSRASPEIAPYPFTTLHPLVGYVEYRDGQRVCLADVPGLVRGAADGRGKGHDFLKHIERTRALMYVIDVSDPDPQETLRVLANELAAYSEDLAERKSLLVANKMDLLSGTRQRREVLEGLQTLATEELGIRLRAPALGISAGVTGEGLSELSKEIRSIMDTE